jgi:hypothetical protein
MADDDSVHIVIEQRVTIIYNYSLRSDERKKSTSEDMAVHMQWQPQYHVQFLTRA